MGQPAGAATPAPYPNVQSDPHAADRVLGEQLVLDRKSTRLNSSHSQISYAVFCLKKKNYLSVFSALNSIKRIFMLTAIMMLLTSVMRFYLLLSTYLLHSLSPPMY